MSLIRCLFVAASIILFGVFIGGCAGKFMIKSIPSPAEVYEADNKIGDTPKEMLLVFKPGEDEKVFVIKKKGYYDYRIRAPKPTLGKISFKQQFIAELEKNHKSFSLNSKPSGASVFLDREKVGITPWTNTLSFPEPHYDYSLLLRKDGYYDGNITIKLRPHEETEYHVDLEKSHKVVRITTDPTGAIVYLSNTKVGVTPWAHRLDFPNVDEQYTVTIKKDGFYDGTTTIKLKPHDKTEYLLMCNKNPKKIWVLG